MAFSQARVKRNNNESVFWFSSLSLARPSVCPPFVSGRRDYCLRVCVCEGARRRIENRDFGSCNSASIFYDSQSSKLSRFFFFFLIRFSQKFVCSWHCETSIQFYVLTSFFRQRCVCLSQRFVVRPLPFSRSRSLPRFERSFGWFDFS
jgi:hypothetical protein